MKFEFERLCKYCFFQKSKNNEKKKSENCLEDYLKNCRFCLKPVNDEEYLEVTEKTEMIFNEFTSCSVRLSLCSSQIVTIKHKN